MEQEIIFKELSYQINGLLFAVHNELGRYYNEKQYGDSFENKLKENDIIYVREGIIPKAFEGEKFGRNRVDFLIDNNIIVEFKCKRIIEKNDYYQVQRYLKAFDKKLGIIVNFRDKFLRPKRILNSEIKNY